MHLFKETCYFTHASPHNSPVHYPENTIPSEEEFEDSESDFGKSARHITENGFSDSPYTFI